MGYEEHRAWGGLTQHELQGKLSDGEQRNRKVDYLKPATTARRRFRTPLLAAAGILLAAASMLALLQPATGRADPAIDSFEQQFLGLLNQYRADKGLQPLDLNSQLTAAADWMSNDMGAKNYFSHYDSLGRSPGQRATAFGYTGGVGENIAAGYTSAQSVFDAWKGSPGHNANMLGSSYRVIGVGRVSLPGSRYGVYWTTDFGTTPGTNSTPVVTVTPTPAATPTPTPTPKPTPQPPTPTPTGVMPTPVPTPTPEPPTPTPAASVFGDVDCDSVVGSADAMEVLRLVALIGEQPECHAPADVDCDGDVTAVDALDILLYVVSLPQPAAQPGCPPIGAAS